MCTAFPKSLVSGSGQKVPKRAAELLSEIGFCMHNDHQTVLGSSGCF